MGVKMKSRTKTPRHADLPAARDNERAKLEEAFVLHKQLLDTRDYAEAIIEAVPPLLVLDEDLRVLTANESFCKAFKISRIYTVNRPVYELGNGQWNIPKLRTLLEEVLPRKSLFKDFEVTHQFEGIGRRTMLLSGRQVDHLQRILLFIEDITERRASQAAVHSSEIRYRRLFEAARDGILILDPVTRKITDANPFMTELLGYSHKELLGKELWQIGLLKDEKASQAAFRELQRKHFIRYENLPLQNKGGQHHEVEFVSNIYEEDGRKVIQCNIRDITERKQTQDALRTSEQRFRALFDLGPIAVYSCDASGAVREFNRRAAELWGRSPKPGDAGQRFCGSLKIFRPDGKHVPHLHCPMADVLSGKIPVASDVEVLIERPNHSRISALVNIVPLKNDRGEITGAINCFYDITERKRSEQALLTAKNEIARHALELEQVVKERTVELRETIGELEGFSYSVSHDMRAPLRAMQSFAQFLVDDYGSLLDEKGLGYLHGIMRSAVRLDRLIQDVLSYTKLLHGQMPMEPVDLDRLVRDMIESFPNGQPIRPEIQIKGSLPEVMGNEALLAQCVSNLLSNGAKFVSPGTTPRVEVSAQAIANGAIRVWFKDNGIGIAPENHKRIFRLFERIHAATEYDGTGIGLTIVRKATERMGAQVGFNSKLGQGSQFWIQLTKA
jgi:PAS domain S-box-containing protein